ncbi:hypothetical protein RND71_003543 [Anisodus tanguticus]|uniref:Uncharacterized protein n=1 Tax=Anisodus tanguticus TaxID=243964 RepID=A0AAE1SW44_9SOLA|nr:hypothetical protein RND71_003543 [Anisodus tanguticus]
MGCDDDLFLAGLMIYFTHCIEKIQPVSWRGDPVWHPFCKSVSAAMACVTFSLHVCGTVKSEP